MSSASAPSRSSRAKPSRPTSHALPILGIAATIAAVECAFTLDTAISASDLRALLRITAQTSLVWFLLAFTARPLVAAWPSPSTKYLLRHRRHFGLSMAISHGVHLAAILALAADQGAAFWRSISITTLIGGGFAYVALLAMVLTSTDRTASLLGRRRWKALHLTGMWTFWLIFTFSYLGMLPIGLLALIPLLAAAALRIHVARAR